MLSGIRTEENALISRTPGIDDYSALRQCALTRTFNDSLSGHGRDIIRDEGDNLHRNALPTAKPRRGCVMMILPGSREEIRGIFADGGELHLSSDSGGAIRSVRGDDFKHALNGNGMIYLGE
jgi:hypothetical protein